MMPATTSPMTGGCPMKRNRVPSSRPVMTTAANARRRCQSRSIASLILYHFLTISSQSNNAPLPYDYAAQTWTGRLCRAAVARSRHASRTLGCSQRPSSTFFK